MLGLGNSLSSGSSLEDLFGIVSGFSLSLDGSDDRVTLSEEITLAVDGAGSNHTISFWAKRKDSTTKQTVLGAHSDVGSVQSNFKSKLDFTTTPHFAIESMTSNAEAKSLATDDTGWHHYVVAWSGQDGSGNAQPAMYEDGLAVSTQIGNFGEATDSDLIFDTIGAVNGANDYEFNGLLYQLAFWNVTLNANAVAAIYNGGNPIPVELDSGNYNNASDLIHLYKFSEGLGAVTDDSIEGGVNGTLKEQAKYSTTTPTHYSLMLSGNSDFVSIDHHASVKPTSALSVSTWVNLDTQYDGTGWSFVNTGSNADHREYVIGTVMGGGYGLYVDYAGTEANPTVEIKAEVNVTDDGSGGDGYLICVWGGKVSSANSQALHEIKDLSGWVHLAMTYDGGVLRLYINGSNDLNTGAVDTSEGQVVDSGVTGKSVRYTQDTKVFLAGDPLNTGSAVTHPMFNGLLDEIAIWSAALDQQAITKIYNNGAATLKLTNESGDYDNQADLEGYWRFEEGTGTTVIDSSTNSNTATLVNNPAWSSYTAT